MSEAKGGWTEADVGYAGLMGEPRQIGDYAIGRILGQGSFGLVRLAVNVKTGEKVAIKYVAKVNIADVDDVGRVYRETFILTNLQHRHIIKLIQVLDTPSHIMLVMEYAGGGDLHRLLQTTKRLPEPLAFTYFQQIISGVEYCHRARIVHRDLKLENILLSSEGEIKVADFGLSNSIKFGQKMDTNCGTPAYTSPEHSKKHNGHTSDIWSLGVILFAMISGFLPFETLDQTGQPVDNVPLLYRRIRNRCFKYPPYISQEARDFLEKMLDPNPETRIKISAMREEPWMTMAYGELKTKLENMKEVTEDMIRHARQASHAVPVPTSNSSSSSSSSSSNANYYGSSAASTVGGMGLTAGGGGGGGGGGGYGSLASAAYTGATSGANRGGAQLRGAQARGAAGDGTSTSTLTGTSTLNTRGAGGGAAAGVRGHPSSSTSGTATRTGALNASSTRTPSASSPMHSTHSAGLARGTVPRPIPASSSASISTARPTRMTTTSTSSTAASKATTGARVGAGGGRVGGRR